MVATTIRNGDITLGTASVGDEQVKTGDPIDCDKLQQHGVFGTDFGYDDDAQPSTSSTRIVFVAQSSGIIRAVRTMMTDTGTSTILNFDCTKNGTTVLTGVVSYTEASTDETVYDGTVDSAEEAFVSGDIIRLVLTETSSTNAHGPFAWVEVEYTAA